jgi:hypothetical protein
MAYDDRLQELFGDAGYQIPDTGIDPGSIADDLYERARAPIPVRQRARPLPQPVDLAPAPAAPPASPTPAPPTFGGDDEVVAPPPDVAASKTTQKPLNFGADDEVVQPATPRPVNSRPERFVPLAPEQQQPSALQPPSVDPFTGMPMPVPQIAPAAPGLPIRPETQAPLATPSAEWPAQPAAPPLSGAVPVVMPNTPALGEGFPAPPTPTSWQKIKEGIAHGFGDEPVGFSAENRAKYPSTFLTWQPFVAPIDFGLRSFGAAIGGLSAAGSEIYKQLGGTETDAARLERDLNIIGQGVLVESGMGGHHNVGFPKAEVRPLSVAEFIARAGEAGDSALVADFQKKALVAMGFDPAAVDAMTPAARQAAYTAEIAKGGFGNKGSAGAAPSQSPGEQLALPAPEQAGEQPSAPSAEAASPSPSKGEGVKPDVKPAEKQQPDQAPARDVDIKVNKAPYADADAILRAYGFSDERIAAMTPAQRAAELADAKVALGVEEPTSQKPASNEAAKTDNVPKATFGEGDAVVGTRDARLPIETAQDLEQVAKVVNTEPTEGQKSAGNYQHGHIRYDGLSVTIENPKGSVRSGTGADGQPWQVEMPGHYGYVRKSKGADGDHVDVLIGGAPTGRAFIVDQVDPDTGKFDEHKVVLGVNSTAAATDLYKSAFSDGKGEQRIGAVTPMTTEAFKEWLSGDTTKPLGMGPPRPSPSARPNRRARFPCCR